MKISPLIFVCFAAFVFCACQNRGAMPQSALRATPPDFTLPDANGAAITLSAYKGKVVLLDFWATWCGGCKVEIPWYMEFAKKYQPNGLAVVGVSMDQEGWTVVKPFIAATQMNYPVVIGDDNLAQRFGLTSMPLTLLIDREGKIAFSHAGVVDKAAFESTLRELLGPV